MRLQVQLRRTEMRACLQAHVSVMTSCLPRFQSWGQRSFLTLKRNNGTKLLLMKMNWYDEWTVNIIKHLVPLLWLKLETHIVKYYQFGAIPNITGIIYELSCTTNFYDSIRRSTCKSFHTEAAGWTGQIHASLMIQGAASKYGSSCKKIYVQLAGAGKFYNHNQESESD